MFGRIAGFGQELARSASIGFQRFPVSALLIIAFSLLANLVAGSFEPPVDTARLLTALSLAATASLAAALVCEGQGWSTGLSWAISGLTAVAMGAFVLFADPFTYRIAGLSTASLLAVPLAPFWGRGRDNGFWSFGLWSIVGLAVAFLSACVFLVGLYAIVEMVRVLFEVSLFEHVDRYILVTGVSLVAPLIALGRVPPVSQAAASQTDDEPLIRTIRPLFDWVLAPLVWLSGIVLYAYIVRTALFGGIDSETSRWLLFVFCTLALLLRIGSDPFAPSALAPTRAFHGYWAWLMLGPIAALALSLWRSTETLGITPSLYFSGVWTLALACIVLIQAVPALRQDIRWLVAIPMVAFALSSFGPWGVVATVERSQTAALGRLTADDWRRDDPRIRAQITTRLSLLESMGGMDAVRSTLPADLKDAGKPDASITSLSDVAQRLGWHVPRPAERPIRSFESPGGQLISLMGYDLALTDLQTGAGGARMEGGSLTLGRDGTSMSLHFDGQQDEWDALLLVRRLVEIGFPGSEPAVFDVTTRAGRQIRLLVKSASYRTDPDRLNSLRATILLRGLEWRGEGSGSRSP